MRKSEIQETEKRRNGGGRVGGGLGPQGGRDVADLLVASVARCWFALFMCICVCVCVR